MFKVVKKKKLFNMKYYRFITVVSKVAVSETNIVLQINNNDDHEH